MDSSSNRKRDMASPAKDRAAKIETYYRQMMDRYDYKGAAESIKFVLKPVIEDWTEFKAALQSYDGVDQSAKSEILNIVNGSGSFEDKDRKPKKKGC